MALVPVVVEEFAAVESMALVAVMVVPVARLAVVRGLQVEGTAAEILAGSAARLVVLLVMAKKATVRKAMVTKEAEVCKAMATEEKVACKAMATAEEVVWKGMATKEEEAALGGRVPVLHGGGMAVDLLVVAMAQVAGKEAAAARPVPAPIINTEDAGKLVALAADGVVIPGVDKVSSLRVQVPATWRCEGGVAQTWDLQRSRQIGRCSDAVNAPASGTLDFAEPKPSH